MNLRDDQKRLIEEVRLLRECETDFGLPAKHVITQLVADSDRPLPDVLPPRVLPWLSFEWPKSGEVDYTAFWRSIDRGNRVLWSGPYL